MRTGFMNCYRHYHEFDTYFIFSDAEQGILRYREDEFIDDEHTSQVRYRLTLIGQKREGKFEEVLLSRSRFLAPAMHSLRFYREYFKPKSELAIEKDRLRWLIKYKDTEFFINLDQMTEPELGYLLEIKSRTWSRKDAERKAQLTNELLALLGASDGEHVTEDYIDIVSETLGSPSMLKTLAALCAVLFILAGAHRTSRATS